MPAQPASKEKLVYLERPYTAAMVFTFANALTWMIVLGTPMVLLGEQLGASTFAVGMAFSAVYLSLPLQVAATAVLPRFGYKRQMVFGWGTRGLAIVVLLAMMWIARRHGVQGWMVPVYVLSAFYFCSLRSIGNAASTPWLYSLLRPETRGHYFASDQAMSSLSGILLLFTLGLLFSLLNLWTGFIVAFAIALVGAVGSTAALLCWPDRPAPSSAGLRDILRKAVPLCVRPSPYRNYLFLVTAWWLVTSGLVPFTAYYLKSEANISPSSIMVYSAIQYVGTTLGALWVRQQVDSWGVRPFFAIAFLLMASVAGFWLAALQHPWLLRYAAVAFFFLGLGNANWFAPNLKFLPQVCPEEERPLALAVHTAFTGMAAGAAPIVWGYFVKTADGSAGMRTERFELYLGMLIIAQLLLIIPFTRLRELEPSQGIPAALAFPIRLFRFTTALLSLATVLSNEPRSGASVEESEKAE